MDEPEETMPDPRIAVEATIRMERAQRLKSEFEAWLCPRSLPRLSRGIILDEFADA